MERVQVLSSSIAGVGYCADRRVLEIEFINGGVYEYLEVPRDEFRAMSASPSKGRHVNDSIKTRYAFRRCAQ